MARSFSERFGPHAGVGDTITDTFDGYTVTARIEFDEDMRAPWEEHDGHGPVSAWTSRDKRPGERILHSDGSVHRYYDWQEAINIAKRDGWDAPPYKTGSKGQQAERAVQRDFEYLKAWCDDEWCWVSVVLSVSRNGVNLGNYCASLGGIDPTGDRDYLSEVADELIDEALSDAAKSATRIVAALA